MKNWLKTHNIPMILLSVVLAVILWMYIVGVENPEKDTEVRGVTVNFVGVESLDDRDLTVIEGLDLKVSLRIRGSRSDLMNLEADRNVTASVDLRELTDSGEYRLPIKLSVPATVNVLSQSQNTAKITVDNLVTQQVPVKVELDPASTIAEGYSMTELASDPENLQVRGPETVMSTVDHARAVLKRENISSTIVMPLDYELVDGEGKPVDKKNLTLDLEQITATLKVQVVKEVPLKVNFTEGGGATLSNVNCVIEPATVTLAGDPAILEDLNQISLGTVDLAQVYTSTKQTMDIVLPNGVTNVSGETEAEVNIEITGLSTKKLNVDQIEIRNAPDALDVDLITQNLTVTIRGSAQSLEMITENHIKAVVDLEGLDLPVGQQTVGVQVTLDGYADVGVLGNDYKVNISISRK